MKDKKGKRYGRVNPSRLADEANFRFVGLAEQLMHIVNWEHPKLNGKKRGEDERETSDLDEDSNVKSRLSWRAFVLDPRKLASLGEKVDQILMRRGQPKSEGFPPESVEEEDACYDATLKTKLKELFHQDAWHRLASVRWFRQHRCSEAISALEGVLSIEESEEVRGEIEHALRVLRVCQASNKGEPECSKSSEVSL